MDDKFRDNRFILIDNNGNEAEYTVLFTFFNKKWQKNYVVYTDNTFDLNGNKNVFASTYNPLDSNLELFAIESEAEWDNIELVLNGLVNRN